MPNDEPLDPRCSGDTCARNYDCRNGECLLYLLAKVDELEADMVEAQLAFSDAMNRTVELEAERDEAVAAEREANARLAWGYFKVDRDGTATRERGWQIRAGMQIGTAIRARGEAAGVDDADD